MSSIDNRVVEMKFDNAQFQKGVQSTLASLGELNKSLAKQAGQKGLETMGAAVDGLSVRFGALQVAGVTALATIAHKAIVAGGEITKSLTIGPIGAGFDDYNEKLTSVQTIMNSTGASLKTVNGYFTQLDTYADKTIYNLRDMTSAFAKFTNAGVSMKQAVPAIKGIANMVALAGQGSQAASIAMYNLSQSIAGGFLTTTDYKSLNLANVATKQWKDQMIQASVAAGTLKKTAKGTYTIASEGHKEAYTAAALFNEKLSEGWANSKVLLKVLGDFGNTATKIGKKSQAAAQDVKSLPMMMETLKASVGTGWTETFEIVIGDLNESKALFTGLTNVIGGFLDASAKARNDLLRGWKDNGGRTALIDAFKNAFEALMSVIRPIKQAFRDIFPATTGKQLAEITKNIRDFTAKLKIGGETSENLRRTFAGLFSIFNIAWEILKGVVKVFFSMFSIVDNGSGGVLALTAAIGDFLVKINEWVAKSGAIAAFFEAIRVAKKTVLDPMIQFMAQIVSAFGLLVSGDTPGFLAKLEEAFGSITLVLGGFWKNIMKGADFISRMAASLGDFLGMMGAAGLKPLIDLANGVADAFQRLKTAMTLDLAGFDTGVGGASSKLATLGLVGEKVAGVWNGLMDAFRGVGNFFEPIVTALGRFFTTLTNKLSEWISDMDFQDAVALLNAGFFIAMYAALRRFIKSMEDVFGSLGNLIDSISNTFDQLTKSLKAMQQNVQSKIILRIAVAVSLLVAAVYALSKIDSGDLYRALGALTAIFAQLVIALAIINKYNLTDMKGLFATGAALVLIAIAIRIMVSSIERLSGVNWADLGKGLVGIGTMLAALAVMTKVMAGAKGIPQAAFGLLILSGALLALSLALKVYASIDFGTLAKGLGSMALVLVALAVAMNLMPKGMVGIGAGLVLVSGAIMALAIALKIMGSMSVGSIIKSITVLSAAMLILVVGVNAMIAAIPGAQALLLVAAALAIFTPILITLGQLDWGTIVKGLVAIAGIFAVIGLAALVLGPVIPLIAALGSALLLLGAAMLAAGAGMFLFAGGLALLATVGAAGMLVLITGFEGILNLLPLFAQQIAYAFVAFTKAIALAAPKIMENLTTVLIAFLDQFDRFIPRLITTIGRFIQALLLEIYRRIPVIARAGLNMIMALLSAIGSRIGRIVDLVTDLIVNFLDALGRNIPRVIQAGFDLIINFLNGIANAIRDNSEAMGEAGGNIATAIVEGMVNGLRGAGGQVVDAARGIAEDALGAVTGFLGIRSPSREFEKVGKYVNQGFAKGLKGSAPEVQEAFNTMKTLLKDAMKAANEDVDKAEEKLKKLKNARKKDTEAIREATKALEEARRERTLAKAAYSKLTKDLDDERDRLKKLAKDYDTVTAKLEAAQDKLQDAIKTRDDYKASIKDQYDDLPDISKETKVVDYISDLEKKVKDTQTFAVTLQRLRDLGLNDAAYKDLLAQGIDALPFAQELLSGGKQAVDQVNKLGQDLAKIAGQLGSSASTELYQAGVDAAKGLVAGLKAEQKNIKTEMDKISAAMVAAVKKALGIKSPSRVFMKVGAFSAQGLINGLKASQPKVGKASDEVAREAIDRMKASMTRLAEAMKTDVDVNPTITPILDLSSVRKDGAKIGSMLSGGISVDSSLSSANSASAGYSQNQSDLAEKQAASATSEVTFNQYNTSPKALSPAEVYRQTRNQISVAKGVLTGANGR